MSKETQAQLSARLKKAAGLVIVGGQYKHYKQHTYCVLSLALREEDTEPVVVYQAEYGERIIFTRPLSSWVEEVEIDGKKVKRFEKTEEDTFWQGSNEIKDMLLTEAARLADIIDEKERSSDNQIAYFGYIKDFLVNSGCLCDDNMQAAKNNAVLLAMIGTRTLLEDTINAFYLKSRPDESARIATAADWFETSNNPEAYKNKIDGKSVVKRVAETQDADVQALHDSEYADFCNYTHSTAHRSILNLPDHRILATKKAVVVSIKAYANILTCIADIITEQKPEEIAKRVHSYFDTYRVNVMEASLDIEQ